MKKRFLVLFCSVIAMIVLSSCGQSYVGKWQSKEVKQGGMTANSDYEKETGLSVGSAYQLEIRDDGTGTVKTNSDLEPKEIEWKQEDGDLKIRSKGASEANYTSFALSGDSLTADKGMYVSYGIYSVQTGSIDSVVCEKVDSFYNTTDMRRYTLSKLAKWVWTDISSTLADLREEGKFSEIPFGYLIYDLKRDTADTSVKRAIKSTLELEGLTEGTVKLEMNDNINRCVNVKITDTKGVSGEFDSDIFSARLKEYY